MFENIPDIIRLWLEAVPCDFFPSHVVCLKRIGKLRIGERWVSAENKDKVKLKHLRKNWTILILNTSI